MYSNTRILIVDDNPAIRDDYQRILSPSDAGEDELSQVEAMLFDEMRQHQMRVRPNFRMAFASQGEEAETLCRAALEQGMPFAVAIVDVRMPPGIDGVETVKRIWKVQSDTQIVLCTAYADYSWREIVEQLGASHRLVVLKKPFDPIEVLQLCQAMCIKWVAEREMACRQIDLQSRLMRASLRVEKMASELYQERTVRTENVRRHSETEIVDIMSGLAANIAHDFNNALTVIQAHLSTALMSPKATAESLPLEQMIKAAGRASLLSRQMMALSSEIHTPLDVHVLNARPVIAQQLEMMGRVLKDKVRIDLYYSGADLFVCASEPLLSRLLNLMVIRAQEITPRGGCVSITLASQAPLEGQGGPRHMMLHVVCPVTPREDVVELQQELQIRLSPAVKLAESLGGQLTSQLSPEWNCTLSLALPEADPMQPQEAVQRVAMARGMVTNMEKKFTFMVVDDEPSICDILGYILGGQGHQVYKAGTALEAWTLWQANRDKIDMVISDIYLPDGLTGFDLAGYIRAAAPDLPIIYMSGYQPAMITGGDNLIVGVNYLAKPFDVLDLLNVITRALERSSSSAGSATKTQPLTSLVA